MWRARGSVVEFWCGRLASGLASVGMRRRSSGLVVGVPPKSYMPPWAVSNVRGFSEGLNGAA